MITVYFCHKSEKNHKINLINHKKINVIQKLYLKLIIQNESCIVNI